MTILRTKYLHSPISYEGLERKERLEYPEKALRETILNAIVHRDYGVDTDITISIFAERIVIWNFGALLPPLSVEMLKKEHPSRRRNSLIAEAFFRAGHIEAWGRGTLTVIGELKRVGLEAPLYREHASGLEVSILGRQIDSAPRMLPKVPTGGDGGTGTENGTENGTETDCLSELQEKILFAIKGKKAITYEDLSKRLAKGRTTIYRHIREMVDKGVIRRVGPARGGHWEVLKK